MTTDRKDVLGIAVFGSALGLVTGMSESAIVASLLAALFAFAGGTLLTLWRGQDNQRREGLGAALGLFSFGLMFGLGAGVLVRGHDLLGIKPQPPGIRAKEVTAGASKLDPTVMVALAKRGLLKLRVDDAEDLAAMAGGAIARDVWLAVVKSSTPAVEGKGEKGAHYLIKGTGAHPTNEELNRTPTLPEP